MPKSRLDYWEPKLARNIARDAASVAALEAAGWQSMIVWECETRDREFLARHIMEFLAG